MNRIWTKFEFLKIMFPQQVQMVFEKVKEVGRFMLTWLVNSNPKITLPPPHLEKWWVSHEYSYCSITPCSQSLNVFVLVIPNLKFRFFNAGFFSHFDNSGLINHLPITSLGRAEREQEEEKERRKRRSSPQPGSRVDSYTWMIKWQHPQERNHCHLL